MYNRRDSTLEQTIPPLYNRLESILGWARFRYILDIAPDVTTLDTTTLDTTTLDTTTLDTTTLDTTTLDTTTLDSTTLDTTTLDTTLD
eukprot:2099385-Lingulodinium_polyedra.AAC.1